MTANMTCIIRVSVKRAGKVFRDIEIPSKASLYELAEAIVGAFRFDFDHAFGFYSGKTRRTMMEADPKYELFVDMGEDTGARSVKKTAVGDAFPRINYEMTFLFDYGDEWHFPVKLIGTGTKVAKVRYPRVIASTGEPPQQYPDVDEDDE
jgi:hypothetical protein